MPAPAQQEHSIKALVLAPPENYVPYQDQQAIFLREQQEVIAQQIIKANLEVIEKALRLINRHRELPSLILNFLQNIIGLNGHISNRKFEEVSIKLKGPKVGFNELHLEISEEITTQVLANEIARLIKSVALRDNRIQLLGIELKPSEEKSWKKD